MRDPGLPFTYYMSFGKCLTFLGAIILNRQITIPIIFLRLNEITGLKKKTVVRDPMSALLIGAFKEIKHTK